MENERIEPVVVLNNVEYYKEENMLKSWKISDLEDGFAKEIFMCRRNIGVCMNSIPMYARYQQEVDEKQRRWYEREGVWRGCSVLVEGTYDSKCPKIAKGFMAYCVLYVEIDDEIGLCYNKKKLFGGYFNVCAAIHNKVNEIKYRRYKDMGRDDLKIKLDYDFYQQHIDSERIYKASSVELDKIFFDGKLSSLLDEYLEWVEAKISSSKNIKGNSQIPLVGSCDGFVKDLITFLNSYSNTNVSANDITIAINNKNFNNLETIPKNKKKYLIHALSYKYGNEWYRDSAKSIGVKTKECSGANVSDEEWKRDLKQLCK